MLTRALALLALLACAADAKQPPTDIAKPFDGVVELNAKNWQKSTRNGKYWFVEFYAPWCQWCKKLAPEMMALGDTVGLGHGKLRIGKVNAEDDDIQEIADHYKVKGFPTLILLKPDGTWIRHKGARTAEAMLEFINEHTGLKLTRQTRPEDQLTGGTGVVQVLNPDNADQLLLNSKLNVMVKFYAPWCGHCRAMADDYKQFAMSMRQYRDIAVAEIDADAHRSLADRFKVGAFPKLLWFTKADKEGVEYQGARVVEAMVAYAKRNKM